MEHEDRGGTEIYSVYSGVGGWGSGERGAEKSLFVLYKAPDHVWVVAPTGTIYDHAISWTELQSGLGLWNILLKRDYGLCDQFK